METPAGVFERGVPGRQEREQEQLVEQLYQEIGQLKGEVDWLRKKGSPRLFNSGR